MLRQLANIVPDRVYDKIELLEYLNKSRIKCQRMIASLSAHTIHERFTEGTEKDDMDYSIVEILLYNLRHTQHHAAQLNLLIRQDLDLHMAWSFRAGDLDI